MNFPHVLATAKPFSTAWRYMRWRPAATAGRPFDDRVQAQVTGVDGVAGEGVSEAWRDLQRLRDGAGAFRGGQPGGS